jgi:hypothetical protein
MRALPVPSLARGPVLTSWRRAHLTDEAGVTEKELKEIAETTAGLPLHSQPKNTQFARPVAPLGWMGGAAQ